MSMPLHRALDKHIYNSICAVFAFKMKITQVEAALGDDLTDVICRMAHKDVQAGVNAQIKSRYGEFERAVLDGSNPVFDAVSVDNWVDWLTVNMKIKDDRFIVFHDFADGPEYYQILAEVIVIDKKIVRVERLHYVDRVCKASSMPEIMEKRGKLLNYIPFQDLMATFYNESDFTIDLEYRNTSRWVHPDMMYDWFQWYWSEQQDTIEDAIDDEEDDFDW